MFRDPGGEGPRAHRFEHLTGHGGPRIHTDSHTSIFVVTGRTTIMVDGHSILLRPGQSVDIPAGHWYSASTVGPPGSLYYVFVDTLAPVAVNSPRSPFSLP